MMGGELMRTDRTDRQNCLKEIAKSISPTGTISHVPAEFLRDMKTYLNMSDSDIGLIFNVARTNVLRKRNTAIESKDVMQVPTPAAAPAPLPDSQGDEMMTLEEFISCNDLTPGAELEYLRQHGKAMLNKLPENSQARVTLYRLLVEKAEARQQQETEEVENNFVKLLSFFRFEYIPACKSAFDSTFKNLKREVAHGIFTQIWSYAQDRELVKAHDSEDEARIKDEIEKKALQYADNQGREFDMQDIFHETGMKFEPIKEAIDRYLARETGAPKLVGGGVVKQDDSKTGGAQYRQAERREQRENDLKKI
jgi:hypothetical protein